MLLRSQFAALAGIEEERLKAEIRRNNLPFLLPDRPLRRYERIQYTPRRAVLLEVLRELTRHGGIAWGLAAAVVRGDRASVRSREEEIFTGAFLVVEPLAERGHFRGGMAGAGSLVPTDDPTKDVWIGVAQARDDEPARFLLGDLGTIAGELTDTGTIEEPRPMARLFLANVTDAIRRVERRATELGINLSPDHRAA